MPLEAITDKQFMRTLLSLLEQTHSSLLSVLRVCCVLNAQQHLPVFHRAGPAPISAGTI